GRAPLASALLLATAGRGLAQRGRDTRPGQPAIPPGGGRRATLPVDRGAAARLPRPTRTGARAGSRRAALARYQRPGQHPLQQLAFKWLLAWLCASLLLLGLLIASGRALLRQHGRHQHRLQEKHRESEASRTLLAIISQAQAAYIDTKNHRQTFDQLLQQILQ